MSLLSQVKSIVLSLRREFPQRNATRAVWLVYVRRVSLTAVPSAADYARGPRVHSCASTTPSDFEVALHLASLTDNRPSRRYNPILGEFFRCRYDYSNGSKGFYIAEQGARHLRTCLSRIAHSLLYPQSHIIPRLRVLLHFPSKQTMHPRRAQAKVQVPRKQRV